MISKNQMKLIRSLNVKKFREELRLFVVEGEKNVNELINSDLKIHSVFSTLQWESTSNVKQNVQNHFEISEKELDQISFLENPNKVLALAEIPEPKFTVQILINGLTLLLEDIQDPGNFGTIIRTADWFGIKNIICSHESVDAFNPKVVQSAMGSLFRVNIFYQNLFEVVNKIKSEIEIPIYGAVLNGENMLNEKLIAKSILIMGNESRGISNELSKLIDKKITIPKHTRSSAESLNVATATSILCYEFFRS